MSQAAAAARKPSLIARAKSYVADGWTNIFTGLGMASDKSRGTRVNAEILKEVDAEELYQADDIAAAIVDTIPEEAARQSYTFTFEDPKLAQLLDDALDELHAPARFIKAGKWARLYGGAAVLVNVDDSSDLSEPLDLNRIRSVKSLIVLQRYELVRDTIDTDINSQNYGEPITWRLNPRQAAGEASASQVIHRSRLLIFHGSELPMRQYISNQYWHDSVLSRPAQAIRNYNVSFSSAAVIMQEFNIGILKVKGLAEMIMNDEDAAVMRRLNVFAMGKGVCRMGIIDEEETYETVGAQLTGVPEMLDRMEKRVVVASRMPHTKLLGDSPSGLGATGRSEQKDWIDTVSNYQEQALRPNLVRLIDIMLAAKQGITKGKVPAKWTMEFCPQEQMNELEGAQARETQSRADERYIKNGVLAPEEVAVSRFAGQRFSYDTTVDVAARKALPEPKVEPTPEPVA